MSSRLSSPELTEALAQLVSEYGTGIAAERRFRSLLNDALGENARSHVLQINLLGAAANSGISNSILSLLPNSDYQLNALAQRLVTEQGISLDHALWTVNTLAGMVQTVPSYAMATEVGDEKPQPAPALLPHRDQFASKFLPKWLSIRLMAALCVLLVLLGVAIVQAFGKGASTPPPSDDSGSRSGTDGLSSNSPTPEPTSSPSPTKIDAAAATPSPVQSPSPSPKTKTSPSPASVTASVPASPISSSTPSSVAPVAAPVHSPSTGSESFRTPGATSFTVPPCVSEIRATLISGRGGKGGFNTPAGGIGTESSVLIPVAAGENLTIFVAENGQSAESGGRGGRGYGNGGNGGIGSYSSGGGGGGGSAIVRGSGALIVVGGGGGSGASTDKEDSDGGTTGDTGTEGGNGAAPDGGSATGHHGGDGGAEGVAGGGGGGGGYVGGGGGSSGSGFGGGGGAGSGYQADDVALTGDGGTVKSPIVTILWTAQC